jgi:glycosyltransferase involved in cell wall biosynthesis
MPLSAEKATGGSLRRPEALYFIPLKTARLFPFMPTEASAVQLSLDIDRLRSKCLRIAWVTRSFLDYRVPVYKALDEVTHRGLHLLYSGDYVPQRVQEKVRQHLDKRAIGLRGEWRIGREDRFYMANRNLSFRFQPGLLKAIRDIRPQVLICDGFFKWTFPALIYRMVTGTPLVILYERTFHTERNAQWFRTLYRKFALRYTDAMSCSGKLCQDYAEWLGMSADRITTGHMVADTDGLSQRLKSISPGEIQELREEWKADQEALVFIYVGRLSQLKGLKELIEGWARFQSSDNGNRCSKSMLVLVGNGPEEKNIQMQACNLGLQNVRFAGAVDYEKLALYYAAANAFIIPTLEDNWSLVVPEAMACGLPILCSKYNGCWPELVQDGCNGWVFDPLNKADIARCIELCIEQGIDNLRKCGKNSKNIIEGHNPKTAALAIHKACELAIPKTV